MLPINQILAYEADDLDHEETLALFQSLVDSGHAWTLQGHYGRTASMLLEEGKILPFPRDKSPNPTS